MSENLMPKIAHMLGVEPGEEFKVEGSRNLTYKFEDNGLVFTHDDDEAKEFYVTEGTFIALLNGKKEIIKLPWQPKKGATYYYFIINVCGKWTVYSRWWSGTPSEYALLKVGWLFRTKEEAEIALPAIAKECGVSMSNV